MVSRVKTPRVKRPKRAIPALRQPQLGMTVAEYLMTLSEWGGTTLERLVDGAAKQIGITFDAVQWFIALPSGTYTVADRYIAEPPTCIFIDGWQHDARPDVAQGDFVKRNELRDMKYRVVELNWRELAEDPMRAVAKIRFEA